MTTDNREEILAKVRKLISKRDSAERIGNQAEANAFASKIVELMAKYNIELSHLKYKDESFTADMVIERVHYEKRHEGDWALLLFNTLCRHNFCSCFTRGEFDGYKELTGIIVIVGEPHNIEIVKYLYVTLLNAGREMGRIGLRNNPSAKRNSYLRAFYSGFVTAIFQRLREDQMEMERDKTPNTHEYGLVLRTQLQKNQNYIENTLKVNLRHKAQSRRGYGDEQGKVDGFQAGKNVGMNKGVQGGTNNLNQKLLG